MEKSQKPICVIPQSVVRTLVLAATILVAGLIQQGCAAVVVGAGAGAAVVYDRRPADVVLADERIELQSQWAIVNDPDLAEHSGVAVTSYNQVVLLTGQAENEQVRGRIEEVVKAQPGVRRIVNEVSIGPNATFDEDAQATYVTSRVKIDLMQIDLPDFDPLRVKVVTEQGTVYLMGLLTREEAAAVVERVRYVSGVNKVVKIFEYVQPKPQPAA
jgi:osmotically-inducible protein OsmY